MAIENILINDTYEDVIKAVQDEALIVDRSPTKMATILILEALAVRAEQRKRQDRQGGNKN